MTFDSCRRQVDQVLSFRYHCWFDNPADLTTLLVSSGILNPGTVPSEGTSGREGHSFTGICEENEMSFHYQVHAMKRSDYCGRVKCLLQITWNIAKSSQFKVSPGAAILDCWDLADATGRGSLTQCLCKTHLEQPYNRKEKCLCPKLTRLKIYFTGILKFGVCLW